MIGVDHPGENVSLIKEEQFRPSHTLKEKKVGFHDEYSKIQTGQTNVLESESRSFDTRRFVFTDENHNDLWLIEDVNVHSFFQGEENAKYAVFYLRPKCIN